MIINHQKKEYAFKRMKQCNVSEVYFYFYLGFSFYHQYFRTLKYNSLFFVEIIKFSFIKKIVQSAYILKYKQSKFLFLMWTNILTKKIIFAYSSRIYEICILRTFKMHSFCNFLYYISLSNFNYQIL